MENKKVIQESIINFRVTKEDKIKYHNYSKSKKILLSRLIKNLLNNELNK